MEVGVDTVSEEVPVPPAERTIFAGLRAIEGPEGDIEAPRLMVPWKPFMLVSMTVVVFEKPDAMTRSGGFADMAKSGARGELTVTVNVVEWLNIAPDPVTTTEYVIGRVESNVET